jgi:D-tyrosyl-tRNA(Tyr) deacylase
MRAVLQRVSEARVTIDGEVAGQIGRGVLVLVGVEAGDSPGDAEWLAAKIVALRIFADDEGKMNRSLVDVAGEALVVSQFTLYGDTRKGRRPSFIAAAKPDLAAELVDVFASTVEERGITVGRGEFGAEMEVELVNDGPMTIWLDSDS